MLKINQNRFLKSLTILFGCEKHRDLVETNFRYVGKRKFKVVSDKITSGPGSPKCSNAQRQEKKTYSRYFDF